MKKLVSLLLFLCCCDRFSFAQLANTTSLVGNITDSAGAAMAGVSVTAVNAGTNDTYRTVTNEEGNYAIEFLKIGTYNVTATQPGFQTVVKSGVVVDYNQTVRADFNLAIGQVSERIVVTASTPPLSTDEASIREVISEKAVVDLPLNGRDPLQLATTAPGVLQGQKATNGVPPGEAFIGAGTREIQNSISLDGISIVNNLITTTPFRPSPDAIQEFEVQTGTYSAQYGAYLGAHLNLITKSGTNDLHGAVWEFLRNDKLDAKNFFQSSTSRKAPLRQNQFGFVVAGPVYIPKLYNGRNRTFFMADYEGLRLVRQSTSIDTVLTPLMRQGNFSEYGKPLNAVNGTSFPGNVIPPSSLSPQALRLLQYMPLPNLRGITNNFEANYPNNDRFNQTIDRLDQNIGDKSRFYFRYALNNEEFLTGATGAFNYTYIPVTTRNWVFGYTQTITPNIVNDFRVGRQSLQTNALNYFYVNNLKTAGSDLGIPGFTGDVTYNNPGIPTINNTGFMSLGNAASNWFQFDTTWQGTDSLTYTHGAHTFIVGAELRKLITSRSAVNSANGAFNFTNSYTGYPQANFMLGLAQNVTTPGPEIRNQVAAWRDGFFFVDNWRATKKLTVNLGIRYELPTVPYTVNGYAVTLNRDQTALIPPNPPQPGFHFIDPNHKNFAPRLGLAYRVTEKTVIRAGYGIYYNPNQTNTFTFLSNNPPFSAVTTCTASATAIISLSNPTPASACGVAKIFNIISPNPYLPTPYMNQWSFDVQQGLWNSGALDIQYLGSQSTHLDRNYYNNTPLPNFSTASVNSLRPNPRFADIRIIQNDVTSNYNGLSVTLRQRLSHGVTALVSYTWSHTLDVSTDSNGGSAVQDPYNWRGDYGNSNWDVRHRFVGSFNYALPLLANASNSFVRVALGGWQTNGIVALQSGFPFNITVPGDPAHTGRSNTQRPNLVGVATSDCGRGHLINCVNASAFATASGSYGNFGRNVLYGPGLYNVDFSLFKNFRFTERLNLQFRSEFFNLFNTPALSNPNSVLTATNFGTITSTKRDNRQIQFALKLQF